MFFRNSQSLLSLAALILTAIAALVILARYLDLKREADEEKEPDLSPEARLAQFERAFYAGQMDAEEFQRIKAALANPNRPETLGRSEPPQPDRSPKV